MAAPSSRKFRSRSDEDDSSGPHAPPAPQRSRRSEDDYVSPKKRRRRSHYSSGYAMPREKPSKIDLQLCVFHSSSGHDWHTAPLSFDRRRIDDRELWEDIRRTYRDELQMAWRRIFLFTRVKHIVPIEVLDLPEYARSYSHFILENIEPMYTSTLNCGIVFSSAPPCRAQSLTSH